MYSLSTLLTYRFDSLPGTILGIAGQRADVRLFTGHRAEAPIEASDRWSVGETVEVLIRKNREGLSQGIALRKRA